MKRVHRVCNMEWGMETTIYDLAHVGSAGFFFFLI